jgi:hypothetical protein
VYFSVDFTLDRLGTDDQDFLKISSLRPGRVPIGHVFQLITAAKNNFKN